MNFIKYILCLIVIFNFQRNPKIEFCKSDLLKLLTYLEGELQAREIVIATLKVRILFVNC